MKERWYCLGLGRTTVPGADPVRLVPGAVMAGVRFREHRDNRLLVAPESRAAFAIERVELPPRGLAVTVRNVTGEPAVFEGAFILACA